VSFQTLKKPQPIKSNLEWHDITTSQNAMIKVGRKIFAKVVQSFGSLPFKK
jgi:hypothetical protein